MPRTLLYITPYFPPASKVGALRPLKFVRHLGDHGYRVIVLADLYASDDTDRALLDAVPAGVDVRFEYSPSAGARVRRALEPATGPAGPVRRPAKREPPAWLHWSPEYVPLGEHSPEIPAAVRAARRIVRENPVDVILVNADPYAAMIVGDRVGAKAAIPVVHDLRDPWSVCDLRRPQRPRLQRAVVDRLERGVVTRAARVILNTETTLAAYRAHYADIDPERFTFVRNHGDAALIGVDGPAARPPGVPFTILFLGNFRRFMHGDAMLRALARLRALGHGADAVRFAVTGAVTGDARARAAELGVADMLEERPYVPYTRIGPAMDAADLLVADIPSTLRIPAKLYDYAMSRRPILALGATDHTELRTVVASIPGARFAPSDDPAAVAAEMAAVVAGGGAQDVPRQGTGLDSATATARLAAVLDAAVAGARPAV